MVVSCILEHQMTLEAPKGDGTLTIGTDRQGLKRLKQSLPAGNILRDLISIVVRARKQAEQVIALPALHVRKEHADGRVEPGAGACKEGRRDLEPIGVGRARRHYGLVINGDGIVIGVVGLAHEVLVGSESGPSGQVGGRYAVKADDDEVAVHGDEVVDELLGEDFVLGCRGVGLGVHVDCGGEGEG